MKPIFRDTYVITGLYYHITNIMWFFYIFHSAFFLSICPGALGPARLRSPAPGTRSVSSVFSRSQAYRFSSCSHWNAPVCPPDGISPSVPYNTYMRTGVSGYGKYLRRLDPCRLTESFHLMADVAAVHRLSAARYENTPSLDLLFPHILLQLLRERCRKETVLVFPFRETFACPFPSASIVINCSSLTLIPVEHIVSITR